MENNLNEVKTGVIEEEKLEPLTEIEPIDEKDSVIKDFFVKENGATVKELASLFGQSEYELKKEFGSYKAKKLSKRLCLFFSFEDLVRDLIYKKLQTADKLGFYGVVVMPSIVPLAKHALYKSSVKIRALIGYPFGEEFYKVIKYSVKYAFQKGADEVIVNLSNYQIKNDGLEEFSKNLKKLKKVAGKRNLTVMLDLNALTPTEVERAIKSISLSGVDGIAFNSHVGVDKSLIEAYSSQIGCSCRLEWACDIDTSIDAVSAMLGGAGILTTANCVEIVSDLNKKINGVGAQPTETVDKSSKEDYN